MKNTTSVSTVREASDNIARPHILDNEFHPVVIEQEKLDNIAAAGGIYSSSKDMSKYIRMLLNNGVFEKDTIVSPKVLNEIFRPQIHFQIFDEPLNNEFTSYGFGWWLTPYKGHKIIEHSGGIDGMQADLIMIQDLDISMVILINSDDIGGFAFSVKFLEQVLNDEAFNLYDLIFSARKNMLGNIIALKAKSEKNHVKETKPSLDLDKYAGIYTDKMYGDIEIVKKNDTQLEIVFSHTPIFSGALKHWHYDTFQVDWYDMRIPDGFITFNFNFKREILGFSIHQKNLLDVDFGELDVVKKH